MSAALDFEIAYLAPEIAWRDLNYDVGWEATSGGVIRCRSVHNRRSDIFNAIDGANLRTLQCESGSNSAFDLLALARRFRHVEIRIPALTVGERFYLTARLLPEGGSVGTVSAIETHEDDLVKGQSALLNRAVQARIREEEYRTEAEIMLRGLQTLLSDSTAAQKLDDLTKLAVVAIRAGAHIVLEVRRDGRVRPLNLGAAGSANGHLLPARFQQQERGVSICKECDANSVEFRKLLRVHDGDVAIIFLPIGDSNLAVLCAPKAKGEFRPEDIGLTDRLSLILEQALVLKEEQEKLIQAARLSALGQMSASLAHEIRQPLNAISMVAQNLELMSERDAVPTNVLQLKVSRILEQVDRASKIMDRIRRFSRKAGDPLAMVDLAKLVEGVCLLLKHDLVTAGVRLEIDVPEDLSVSCDAIQIEQVFGNLIRNASDALAGIGTAKKTANGTITVRGRKTQSGVSLRVEDNGPGFPEDVASRPLETYYTSKSSEHGTGLGLSICHMIAREHAGSLHIGNHDAGAFVELLLPHRSEAH